MPDYPLAAVLITLLLAAAVCIVILALTGNI